MEDIENKKNHLKTQSIVSGQPISSSPNLYQSIEHYCMVFDLCSSSTILENIQSTDHLIEWVKFWEELTDFLVKQDREGIPFNIYKFIGDGFLLLFELSQKEVLIEFCKKLYKFVIEKISNLVESYCEIEPDRMGITIGIERGSTIEFKIDGGTEYTGKAINVATRLQSSLKEPEQTNKLLISKKVKNEIELNISSEHIKRTDRKLRNLYGDQRFPCFEIDLKSL